MILWLPFPPSVNNLFITTKNRKRVRSPRYRAWSGEAGSSLKEQRAGKVTGPVVLTYEFQDEKDKRKRDLANLEKATTDLLVEHQVIEADDNTIVREIILKWSREVVGVRVTIENVKTESQQERAA